LLLIFDGMAGLLFGLLLSIVSKTVIASLFIGQLFVYPTAFISGELRSCDVFIDWRRTI
jgi:hypothetical protein